MTEKEKKESGELYLPSDPELIKERVTAKKLCVEYNAVPYNDYLKRERTLSKIVSFKGENVTIEQDFMCDYGYNIFIGDNFFSDHGLLIHDCGDVNFGDNVYIGPNCIISSGSRPIDAQLRNKGYEYAKPIKIGNNVWIGGGSYILPGVTIGDDVVIGAGSIVAEDIPSGSVASGNPCRVTGKTADYKDGHEYK